MHHLNLTNKECGASLVQMMLGMAIISSFVLFGVLQYREISTDARNLSAFEEIMAILDDIKSLRATYGRGAGLTNTILNQQPRLSSGTNVYGRFKGADAESVANTVIVQFYTPQASACSYIIERLDHLAQTNSSLGTKLCIGGVNLLLFVE